jgi:hypothetical protein
MAQDQQMEYWVIPMNMGNELGNTVPNDFDLIPFKAE